MKTDPKTYIQNKTSSGREIAAALDDAIYTEKPDDFEELTLLAHRIRECNRDANLWYGEDLHSTDTGELYNGAGKFWNCNSKLCSTCVADAARRHRKQIEQALNNLTLYSGQYRKFITLTIPNLGLSITESRRILYYAWTLFRKRKWFKQTILGCVKSEEFTLTKRGYHYHAHLIAITKYVDYHKFRSEWSECVHSALTAIRTDQQFMTSDGLAMANVRAITSISEAVKEVAKYITKTSSWKKLRTSDLLEVARIKRWPRMLEFHGSMRTARLLGVASDDEAAIDNKTILDTKCISDGNNVEHGWKAKARQLGAEQYLVELHESINRQFEFRREQLRRRYEYATLHRIYEPRINSFKMTLARIAVLRRERLRLGKSTTFGKQYVDSLKELDARLGLTIS